MPFHDYTGIPRPDAPDKTVGGVLLEWMVAENDCVEPERVIARVQIGSDAYSVRICFPALMLKLCAVAGQRVADTDYILKWAADGESIPYGRKHFETVKENAEPSAPPNGGPGTQLGNSGVTEGPPSVS